MPCHAGVHDGLARQITISSLNISYYVRRSCHSFASSPEVPRAAERRVDGRAGLRRGPLWSGQSGVGHDFWSLGTNEIFGIDPLYQSLELCMTVQMLGQWTLAIDFHR